jgi:hypothetical protein
MKPIRIGTMIFAVACIVACVVEVGQPALSQDGAATPGVPGYLDPQTGTFKPLIQRPIEDADAAPATPTTGTFTFTFTITLKSTNLGTDKIVCAANVSTSEVISPSGFRSVNETASIAATGSGATRACTLTIPYSWPLSTAKTDTVSLSYTVNALPTIAGGAPLRLSTQTLPSMKVPASGATTAIAVESTI